MLNEPSFLAVSALVDGLQTIVFAGENSQDVAAEIVDLLSRRLVVETIVVPHDDVVPTSAEVDAVAQVLLRMVEAGLRAGGRDSEYTAMIAEECRDSLESLVYLIHEAPIFTPR